MRININEIPFEGLRRSFSFKEQRVRSLVESAKIDCGDDFLLDMQILRADDTVIFRGDLKTCLRLDCSSCGEAFGLPIDRQFTSTYCRGEEGSSRLREEVRLTKGDLDITFFQGDEIDLGSVIQEQLVLSLPYRPVCKEECKGLCPYCGRNLNEGDCRCERGSWSLKFSALLDPHRESSVDS